MIATQQGEREKIHVLFPDAVTPKELDSMWGESMTWSVDAFNRTCTSGMPELKSPHETYFGKQASLRLLPFLAPDFTRRSARAKDQLDDVPLCSLEPAKHHYSGTTRVSVKDTNSFVIARDMTWRDLPCGKKSRLERATSSARQVTSEMDATRLALIS